MKKIILNAVLLFSLLGFNSQAQGLKIFYAGNEFTGGDLYVTCDASISQFSLIGVQVKNEGSVTKAVKVFRDPKVLLNGTQNSFCWDVCYDSLINSAQNPINIAPGGTSYDFIGDYLPHGQIGTSIIRYFFRDENNIFDTVSFKVHYQSAPTGIKEVSSSTGKILGIFPNPANDNVNISVNAQSGSTVAEFINVLGQVKKSVTLTSGIKNQEISIADLAAGAYLVSLKVNGQVSDIKKLIVK